MFDEWGLAETVTYGRSPVMLFSGPPGVGKTAAAEALACELGKTLLVADYSRIQSCFVGQTEKNVVRAFREARNQDAVLFWDEADAMFYSRDSARWSWEVREVNVLLEEIERFEGMCILATNRTTALDPALQRRIAVKVLFERPDESQRRRIWEKLLPEKMPLAKDVNLHELSRADLVGGEIKNAILNAARLALQRGADGPITNADFCKAILMEQEGKWKNDGRSRIGFRA
jgi:SpoVK/Ycf46/Vps4 family AAA+-type ATPase